MGGFVKSDVVVVLFPFSDLSTAKKRPALVIAPLEGDDVILCQITSRTVRDRYSIPVVEKDFEQGSLRQDSNIRPNRIFTADRRIIQYRAGHLKDPVLHKAIERIIGILTG